MSLSSLELRGRAENLLKDQKARDERLAQQREKERILAQRRAEREQQREEEARARRLEEQAKAEQAEKQREETTEWNRGVYLATTLQPVDLDEALVAAKGIRRSKDKVILPASMGNALMNQGAMKNGAMLFHLTAQATGRSTHAGLLEFTGPEGTILLPSKVRECLFGHGSESRGLIDVQYRRLEKGTFVRFQPLTRNFHESVGDDVRQALEAALMQHCTLSVGDTVHVDWAGQTHTLRVTDLQPQPAVSVIDIDVEAEVVASVETEQLIEAWESEQRANRERLAQLRAQREAEEEAQRLERERVEQEQREAAARAAEAAAQAAAAEQAAAAARIAALPVEPPANSPQPTMALSFRLPDGTRLKRRFYSTAPVSELFKFVDAHGAGGCLQIGYQLVTQYPRRVITREPDAEATGSHTQTQGQQDAGGQTPMEVDGQGHTQTGVGHTHAGGQGTHTVQGIAAVRVGGKDERTLTSLGLATGELLLLEPLADE